jgi:hypothetical protein
VASNPSARPCNHRRGGVARSVGIAPVQLVLALVVVGDEELGIRGCRRGSQGTPLSRCLKPGQRLLAIGAVVMTSPQERLRDENLQETRFRRNVNPLGLQRVPGLGAVNG